MEVNEVLKLVAKGEMSIEEAEASLVGYVTGDAGRFDASRIQRRGVPEAIFAPGKATEEVVELALIAIESTDHALVTRVDSDTKSEIEGRISSNSSSAETEFYPRSGTLVIHGESYDPASLDATVGVVSAGTADAGPAEEARIIVTEMGANIVEIFDIGIANVTRLIDQLPKIRSCDVVIVAAGREGALPTLIAGLIDRPVIGLPVSSGYGFGGDGHAALLGMLQSCTVLSVVNIDAGFVAGAQAGLIASAIHSS